MLVTDRPVTWVVGSRGLLGSSVVRHLRAADRPTITSVVPWGDADRAVDALDEAGRRLVDEGSPWRLLWCAGAGVIGTSERALQLEVEVLQRFLDRFRVRCAGAASGVVFVASSAGGVHAGSDGMPFTEVTDPSPISPYGETKLAVEQLVRTFGEEAGIPTLRGRIANLYGPGQDLTKAQGLISQLCLNHLTRRPSAIYVSLDTARDYLYVDDCARMVLRATELAAEVGGPSLKIMASERAVTVGALLGELKRVTRRRPQIVLAQSTLAQFQTKDLRFRSTVWPQLRAEARTPLAAGIHSTLNALSVAQWAADQRPPAGTHA
jgi:UDP-glucose 4-epimerase